MADPAVPHVPGAEHQIIAAGDVHLHVVSAGKGPLVVLLHGFPELWWSWRHQLPALAAAGYRVVAPDLRGYGGSDQPEGVGEYTLAKVADDIAALVRALGEERATVVGHDYGGGVAWLLASRHPAVVERLAVLNAPHPSALARALRRPEQLLRSSYMLLFQVPLLPERLLAARDHTLLRLAYSALRATKVTHAELDVYAAAAAAEGLGGPLAYYRASGRSLVGLLGLGPRARDGGPPARIEVPVLVVWGERDPTLAPWLAEPPPDIAPHARVVRIPEASHFVHQDAPGRVNELLLELLRG